MKRWKGVFPSKAKRARLSHRQGRALEILKLNVLGTTHVSTLRQLFDLSLDLEFFALDLYSGSQRRQ